MRSIIFSGEHPSLVLSGQKTMTRRVVKNPDKCPYGEVGDLLYGKETWAYAIVMPIVYTSTEDGTEYDEYLKSYDGPIEKRPLGGQFVHRSGFPAIGHDIRWRSSYFMPKSIARITIRITDLRREPVQAISNEDAIREGIFVADREGISLHPGDPHEPRDYFMDLWDSLNAKRGFSWASNPDVWVISFEIEVKGCPPHGERTLLGHDSDPE